MLSWGTKASDLKSSLPLVRSCTKYQPIFAACPIGGNASAVDDGVEQHGRACHVVTPLVVRHLLVMPDELARRRFECDERHGVEIVAGTSVAHRLRRGIAGAEIEETALRIDGGRVPDRTAAEAPGIFEFRCGGFFLGDIAVKGGAVTGLLDKVAFPALFRRLEAPLLGTRFGVEGGHEARLAVFSGKADDGGELTLLGGVFQMQAVADAGDADEHHPVVDKRSGDCADARRAGNRFLGQRIVGFDGGLVFRCRLRLHEPDVPDLLARRLVKRDQMGIDGRDIDLAVADRHAAVGGSAAELVGGALVLVAPFLLTRRRVEGNDMRIGRRQKHDPVDDQRRRLEGARDSGLIDELRNELLDVAGIDGVERRETLVGVVPAMQDPVGAIGARAFHARIVDGCIRVRRDRQREHREGDRETDRGAFDRVRDFARANDKAHDFKSIRYAEIRPMGRNAGRSAV